MTYKQMLVPYPGLRSPVDNRYDLLVSGAAFLVGMCARPWCRLKDPLLHAHAPAQDLGLKVLEIRGKLCWPESAASELALEEEGELRLPVYNEIRRDFRWHDVMDTAEDACYLIARNMTCAEFRNLLVIAEISR